ncbi:hypothetical protein [Pseudomonas putida]
MNVETSTVTKVVISDVPRLDPITVFLEDFGRRDCPTDQDPKYQTAQGKITISCWDKSWNAYWGGMGPRTVAEFVTSCNACYVLNCLDRGISPTRFSGSALEALAKRTVIKARRDLSMDADDARRLYEASDDFTGLEVPAETWHHNDLLTEIFGDEWWHTLQDEAVEENHEYTYLLRIVEAVQQALAQPIAAAA